MAHKITHRSFADNRTLEVHAEGVRFTEASGFSSHREFRFDEILCVLLSPENLLSFQAGSEVFSVPTDPANAAHQAALEALLAGVNASAPTLPPPPCPTSASES